MKKYLFISIFFLTILQCEFTTEPQEITLDEEKVNLEWIKFRDDNVWYLSEFAPQFDTFTYKKECSEILFYPTKLFFFYEINGERMIQEISSGSMSDPSWIWKEKQ